MLVFTVILFSILYLSLQMFFRKVNPRQERVDPQSWTQERRSTVQTVSKLLPGKSTSVCLGQGDPLLEFRDIRKETRIWES